MKLLVATAMIAAMIGTANACAPAPTCWIESGPAYLRSVCKSYVNTDVKQIAEYLDEPEKVSVFVKACAKVHVQVGQMTR